MEASMARNGSDTSVRVSILENQVTTINSNIEKLEMKMDANYTTLHSRISDLRDDLHTSIETKHEKLVAKLDEQADAHNHQHEELNSKVQLLEKWRWMIMGGALVVGYVLAHVKLENLF